MESIANGIAGAAGSVAAVSLVYPLEKISKEMQTKGERSALVCAKRVYEQGALYQGLNSGLVAMGATMYTFFWSHHTVKRILSSIFNQETLSPTLDFIAGSLSGAVTAAASEPIWMVNARLTVDPNGTKERYTGILDCIQKVYRHEGLKAFFAGLGGAFGTVAASAIQLSCYEQCKKYLNALHPDVLNAVFMIGALCKIIATILTFPLTTISSRMQNQRKDTSSSNGARPKYKGSLDCALKMIAAEGPGSLFAGIRPKLLQQFLQNGFRFLFYERIVEFIRQLLLSK